MNAYTACISVGLYMRMLYCNTLTPKIVHVELFLTENLMIIIVTMCLQLRHMGLCAEHAPALILCVRRLSLIAVSLSRVFLSQANSIFL